MVDHLLHMHQGPQFHASTLGAGCGRGHSQRGMTTTRDLLLIIEKFHKDDSPQTFISYLILLLFVSYTMT